MGNTPVKDKPTKSVDPSKNETDKADMSSSKQRGREKEKEREKGREKGREKDREKGREMKRERRKSSKWRDLRGKFIPKDKFRWFNLSSNRFVKNKPRGGAEYALKGIRVLGTVDQLRQFCEINKIDSNIDELLFRPFDDILFLSEEATRRIQACNQGFCEEFMTLPQTGNVEELSPQQINQIDNIGLEGIFTKGRVVNIVDGDTLDAIVYVPLLQLSMIKSDPTNTLKDTWTSCLPVGQYRDAGFFTRVRIRVYGYDAAEKETHAGKLAKKLLDEKIEKLGGIIWCQFIGQEKYDRVLAVLYEDENRKRCLNDYILKQEEEHNIKMVHPYLGGTKQEF